jgi:hypothetical protein
MDDDTAVSSLTRTDRDCITEHGRAIGKSLHATITLIRDFIDFLSKQPFRYSMFGEISTAFAQVQINSLTLK